ncbi:MAG TPA: hypothetical protein VL688_13135 [Verrucomicrobiae bacterium]|nr:hypothetical protein [Verrucomicrobiae bacterium]
MINNTKRFLNPFLLLAFSMTAFLCPSPARAISPENSIKMKQELRAEDFEYLSRLRQELLKINKDYVDKATDLKEELWNQKRAAPDRAQDKTYEQEYAEKMWKLKKETSYAKYSVKKELNGDRLVNRGKIIRSYEEAEPEKHPYNGIRG